MEGIENDQKSDEYLETLVDIAVNCGSLIQQDKIQIVDSRSIAGACREIADEFTSLHEDTDWGESELSYIEEIDTFAESRLKDRYPL